MNSPYTPRPVRMTHQDQLEWHRYERANARAKWRYYAHRRFVDDRQECPVCLTPTYASDGIHAHCKENEA